jgi:hypothetical protein
MTMIQLRTLVPSVAAALFLTVGASTLAGVAHAMAAEPQTQSQMMPGQMNPGMGMGMSLSGLLPIYSPSASGLLWMPSYSMPSATYSASSLYSPLPSYSSGYASSDTVTIDLQQVCHQYDVGLQYNTMADDPSLDQACGVSGSSSTAASSSSTPPTQSSGYSYP